MTAARKPLPEDKQHSKHEDKPQSKPLIATYPDELGPDAEEKGQSSGSANAKPTTSAWSKVKRGGRIGYEATLGALEALIFAPFFAVELILVGSAEFWRNSGEPPAPKSSPINILAFLGTLVGGAVVVPPLIAYTEVSERIGKAKEESDEEDLDNLKAPERKERDDRHARNSQYILVPVRSLEPDDENEGPSESRYIYINRAPNGNLRYRTYGMTKPEEISEEELGKLAAFPIGELSNQKDAVLDLLAQRGHVPSHKRSLGLAIFYGFFGFLAGLVLMVPLALNAMLIQNRQETFARTLLNAPFRFLWTLFSTPFNKAQEWAWFRKIEVAYPDRTLEHHNYTYKLTGFDYPRVSFYALAGFVLGCIEAPFYAIQNAIRSRPDETPFWALLMALPRFFGALFTRPFARAEQWVHDCRDQLDKHNASFLGDFYDEVREKDALRKEQPSTSLRGHSPLGYIRLFLNAALGFIVGLSFGAVIAIRKTFYPIDDERSRPPTNLLESIYSFAGRLLTALVKAPFQSAMDYALIEAQTLEEEKETEKKMDKEAPRAQTSRGIAALKLIGGFLLGLLAMPFIGTYTAFKNFIFEKHNERFIATVLKTPFRLVLDILAWPFSFAYNLAWPRRDLEAEKNEKSTSKDKPGEEGQESDNDDDKDDEKSLLSSTARANKKLGKPDKSGDSHPESQDSPTHSKPLLGSGPHLSFGSSGKQGGQQIPLSQPVPLPSFPGNLPAFNPAPLGSRGGR